MSMVASRLIMRQRADVLPPDFEREPLTGAGSLLLEFITLSRLTSDPTFESLARRAFFAIWDRRSDIGLVGNTIDARSGTWMHGAAGTGAGIDSFYECVCFTRIFRLSQPGLLLTFPFAFPPLACSWLVLAGTPQKRTF